MWENDTLINFIKDRSNDVSMNLLPKRPSPPIDSLLVKDRVSKEQILLRQELDNIQGSDKDNDLTGNIVKAITLGSRVKPISKDSPYTTQEIGDHLNHLDEVDKWEETKKHIVEQEDYQRFAGIKNIPILTCLYSIQKNEPIIIMSYDSDNIIELNTNVMDTLRGRIYSNEMGNYRKLTIDEIEDHLINVDFEELRKRLINSGYTSLVNEINEDLQHYL